MSRIFVDTNVLVYADQPASEFHQVARDVLVRREAEDDELWISRQVLREYLSVMTRPNRAAPGQRVLTPAVAASAVEAFIETFWIAEDGAIVTDRLLSLITTFGVAGRQIHDSNIVATMLAHGIQRLATFNVGDFRRFAGLIELEPTVRT